MHIARMAAEVTRIKNKGTFVDQHGSHAMRATGYAIVFLTLLTTLAPVHAQPPEGGRGGRFFGRRGGWNDLMRLTSVREVRAELALDDEQVELLEALAMDLRDQRRTAFRRRFDVRPGPGDGETDVQDVAERIQKLDEQTEALVAIVLEPNQMERLNQLRLQYEGVRAFERDGFAKQLDLSDDQQKRISQLLSDALPPGPRGNDGNALERLEEQIASLLTDAQSEKWTELKGKPFSFPEPRWRGPRGNGRRP